MTSKAKSTAILSILLGMACSPGTSPVLIDEEDLPLKHIVLLDLKETCTAEEERIVIERLNVLADISGVHDLSVNRRIESGDDRAITDYDIMLYMEFENSEELRQYAGDSTHLSIREELVPYMAARPRVIDAFAQ